MCNHPDLFEGRPIVSAFDDAGIHLHLPTAAVRALERDVWTQIDLPGLHLLPASNECMARWEANSIQVPPPPSFKIAGGYITSTYRKELADIKESSETSQAFVFRLV